MSLNLQTTLTMSVRPPLLSNTYSLNSHYSLALMVYDLTGSWSDPPGPNAPLNDTCAGGKTGSVVSALANWTNSKFPANKLVLGVGSYGRSFNITPSSALSLWAAAGSAVSPQGATAPNRTSSQRANACQTFAKQAPSIEGSNWDGYEKSDACGNPIPSGGIWNFWGLINGGYLTDKGKPASGIEYRYDACSQTVCFLLLAYRGLVLTMIHQPYVYSPATQIMISYDDAMSFCTSRPVIFVYVVLG